MLPALMLLAAGVQGGMSIFNGAAEKAASERNAAIMRQNAQAVRLQGYQSEEEMRRQQSLFLAESRTAAQQSGFDATSGSMRDIQQQSDALAELDILTMRYENEMRALGIITQASETERAGRDAMRAGVIGAGAAALSGYANYSQMNALKVQ